MRIFLTYLFVGYVGNVKLLVRKQILKCFFSRFDCLLFITHSVNAIIVV